jgi:hypothetical protein
MIVACTVFTHGNVLFSLDKEPRYWLCVSIGHTVMFKFYTLSATAHASQRQRFFKIMI